MTRVLVCGGRNYSDRKRVANELCALAPSVVIHGGAPGADSIANEWTYVHRVKREVYKPDWARHGKAAGPIRNAKMLSKSNPDLVLAFPGGTGTADMVRKAKAAGVRVIEIAASNSSTSHDTSTSK